MDKTKLLCSCSAGETSMMMAIWLKANYSDKFEIINVFANVGEENEETLVFADRCDKYFGLNLVWVEPLIREGKSTKHTIVDFETAERSGINGNFERLIKRFGIPNRQNMMCTREMKERPITSFARSIGWNKRDYFTAIGIRSDEVDRISKNRRKNRLIYPFIELTRITKPMVNCFWKDQPFRLELKGYEGNCKWCWKKSDRKNATVLRDNPERFEFPRLMEKKYYDHVPTLTRERLTFPLRFYRNNKAVADFIEIYTAENFEPAKDDMQIFDYQSGLDLEFDCIGSCEPFNS